ncbi:MAG: hypothetical protein K5819_07950 [Lachnospiraceae bacterium]|nr:hypothetical protein [Lachnospiraceae bacterium]
MKNEEKSLSSKWDGLARTAGKGNFRKDIQKLQQFIQKFVRLMGGGLRAPCC